MNLFLREPALEDKEEVLKMCKELDECGDEYPFEGVGRLEKLLSKPYEEWLVDCESDKTVETLNPTWSNGTNYLLVDDNNHVYGFSQLRHSLKGELINIGGNIGYAIRPSERRKGYATIQLQLLLEKAEEKKKKKTIEKCLGEQDKSVPSRYPNIMELRYWINTKTLKK